MTSPLAGKNICILVANGFDETAMTEIQRALIKVQAVTKTVAPEQGVVNGWQGAGWGHYFPVNSQIGETLGSDFDMLVLPGGERAMTKLKTNLHTRRIINHFVDAGKPIAAIGSGVGLLALATTILGTDVAAPADVQAELKTAGAVISDQPQIVDGAIVTSNGADIAAWIEAAMQLTDDVTALQEAA